MVLKKNYPHSPFLFVKYPVKDNKTLFNAYIINIPEVTWTLQKYYLLFSKELKMEFDPLDATLEVEDPNSTFWNKIFANSLLQGILYGYGERNAYLFSRQFDQEGKLKESFDSCIFPARSSVKNRKEERHLEELQLPLFRSYDVPYGQDPIIIQYEQERNIIQKKLKGKDFTEEVFNRLMNLSH